MQTDLRINRAETAGLDEAALFEMLASAVWPGTDDDEQHLMSLGTPGHRAMYTTTLFSRLICCDGLLDTILNTDPWLVEEAIAGFARIGAADEAIAFRSALGIVFPDGAPQDSDERWAVIDRPRRAQLDSVLGPLNRIFFEGEERLVPKWREYVNSHQEEFFCDPR